MKRKPTEGWVRGRFAMTPETQTQIAELRAKVAELERQLDDAIASRATIPDDLAFGDDIYQLHSTFTYQGDTAHAGNTIYQTYEGTMITPVSWEDLFNDIGPRLLSEAAEEELKLALDNYAYALS